MLKNACRVCKIYFPDNPPMFGCPVCGQDMDDLQNEPGYRAYLFNNGDVVPLPKKKSAPLPVPAPESARTEHRRQHSDPQPEKTDTGRNSSYYEGRIISYTTNESRAGFFEGIGNFFRGMHRGHTCHVIVFRDQATGRDYQVNFYGLLGGGAYPSVGANIVVHARPNMNGIFLTERVTINGSRLVVRNQPPEHVTRPPHYPGEISPLARVILVLLLILGAWAAYTYIPAVKAVVSTYIITLIILFCLAIFVRPLQRLLRQPVVFLVAAGIVTAVIYNVGGLGSLLAGIAPSLLLLGLTIAGLIYIIRGGFR